MAYFAAFPNPLVGTGCGTENGRDDATSACTGYELTEDLDFDTDGDGAVDADDEFWNGGEGWEPIRGSGRGFVSTFEGNGHTITHLYINRAAESGLGLFGYVVAGGEIRNVEIREVMVRGREHVGGLVHWNGGSIAACTATGTVEGVRHPGSTSGGTVGGAGGHEQG